MLEELKKEVYEANNDASKVWAGYIYLGKRQRH